MNRARAEQILNGISGKVILTVGDVMLDEFIWGKVRRISPEAPVPVVEVLDETYRLGGTGNVVANIRGLEGTAIPVGGIGRDAEAGRNLDVMKQNRVGKFRPAVAGPPPSPHTPHPAPSHQV